MYLLEKYKSTMLSVKTVKKERVGLVSSLRILSDL